MVFSGYPEVQKYPLSHLYSMTFQTFYCCLDRFDTFSLRYFMYMLAIYVHWRKIQKHLSFLDMEITGALTRSQEMDS